MTIVASSARRLPSKLAAKLPLSLGSDTPIQRHASQNRKPDRHKKPAGIGSTPRPAK